MCIVTLYGMVCNKDLVSVNRERLGEESRGEREAIAHSAVRVIA